MSDDNKTDMHWTEAWCKMFTQPGFVWPYDKPITIYNGIDRNVNSIIPEHLNKKPLTQSECFMKQEKKIIGYKAPKILFSGDIQVGDLYNVSKVGTNGCFPKEKGTNYTYYLPKEIVETWEPVYEEEKYEKGKWYYVNIAGHTAIVRFEKHDGYQWWYSEKYGEESVLERQRDWFDVNNVQCLATIEEIESHLIAEAKRRGFVEGVYFHPMYSNRREVASNLTYKIKNEFSYHIMSDTLCNGGNIYSGGTWAEIVKNHLPEIGGYKGKIDGDHVIYGCNDQYKYHKSYIKNMLISMSLLQVESVNHISGRTVSRSELEEILQAFDK